MCKNKESNKQMEKTVNLNVNAAYEAKSKTLFLRLAIHLWWIHIYAVFLLGFSLTEYTRSLVISPPSSTALFYFSVIITWLLTIKENISSFLSFSILFSPSFLLESVESIVPES